MKDEERTRRQREGGTRGCFRKEILSADAGPLLRLGLGRDHRVPVSLRRRVDFSSLNNPRLLL